MKEKEHFNPLPRKEGDFGLAVRSCFACSISIHSLVKRETRINNLIIVKLKISIHSLVKRETADSDSEKSDYFFISIHSLVKRETDCEVSAVGSGFYFNPLPRKEGDPVPTGFDYQAARISIHSLVKRETAPHPARMLPDCYFNPLPRKEGDLRKSHESGSNLYISIHSLVKRETDVPQ